MIRKYVITNSTLATFSAASSASKLTTLHFVVASVLLSSSSLASEKEIRLARHSPSVPLALWSRSAQATRPSPSAQPVESATRSTISLLSVGIR